MITNNSIKSEFLRALSIESLEIANIKNTINLEKIEEVINSIFETKNQGKIIVSACGTSAMAGRKIVHSLNCIECPSVFLNPSDALHGGLGVLQKNDILILISKGGNTEELTKMIQSCKAKGAKLIGVGENELSTIAKESDIFLKIKVEKEPCPFNMLATASTLAVISIFDSICIALMMKSDYTKEQFAIIHPSGAVGNRLLNK